MILENSKRSPDERNRHPEFSLSPAYRCAHAGYLLTGHAADIPKTGSMLRRIARSPRGAHRAGRLDNAVRVTPAIPSISSSTSARRTSSRCFSIKRSVQHLRLHLDMLRVGLRARRLLPLAPQVSQVDNAALIEREAVTLPLDHAFGFELADVGPAAIEVLRQCRRADGRGLSESRSRDRLGDGADVSMATVAQPSCSFMLRLW